MATVLLVRHAQSEWNATGRWQGWADPPLSEIGRHQAALAGERLRRDRTPFTRAVSSDLDRARTTAAVMAGIVGMAPAGRAAVQEIAELRELDVGQWSGLDRDQIHARWPAELAAWRAGTLEAAPGGEPRSDFDRRVRTTIEQLTGDDRGAQILIVAHGGVIRSVARWFGASQGPVPHLAGFWLEHDGDRTVLASAIDLLGGPSEVAAPGSFVP